MKKKKTIYSWSGGKDSAMGLYRMLRDPQYQVVELLTTVNRDYGRTSMHGVRRKLHREQAKMIGLPVREVELPASTTNEEYEETMRAEMERARQMGIEHVAFADIFLEDLKQYREKNLAEAGMKGVFPIWKRETDELSREFIGLGFKAVVTCVDTKSLDESFCGREYDQEFLDDLPESVDPCGENGEFHTFVYDGPVFSGPVPFTRGEVVKREERFYYCDLLPGH